MTFVKCYKVLKLVICHIYLKMLQQMFSNILKILKKKVTKALQ